MANNPYVNKVETADGSTLMDITDTTATTDDVESGKVFYAASGERSVGTSASVHTVTMNGTTYSPTDGDVDLGTVVTDISGKKDVQTAVSDPSASGTSLSFIATLSQNENGEITATKKNVSVANDLTTSTEGSVLDARQGKALNDGKADKVSSATNGNFAGLNSSGNLTDSGKKASDFKTTQTAKTDPTASGTAVSFIDTISQNANGVITATKKTVRTFTKSGSSAASGLVPAPSTTAGTTKFLREDATWQVALTQHQDISGKKNTQSAVSDPSASGNAISFIDSISQNAQGVITPTKKTVRSASDSQSGVVTTGTQTFAGKKTFTGAVYQQGGFRNMNSTTSPNIGFSGSDLDESNAVIYAVNSEASGSKYGEVYFQFYQYSPASGGASRTDYSDRYRFPAVASGKTANSTYTILAAGKNAPTFSSFTISANSNKTFTVGNSYRGMFYLIGTNASAQEQVMVYSTSSGSVAYSEYQQMALLSSPFTFTKGTGTLKIANGSSYTVYVQVMTFNGSVS